MQTWPGVVECAALPANGDCPLRELVRDLAHHLRRIMKPLLEHPTVQ